MTTRLTAEHLAGFRRHGEPIPTVFGYDFVLLRQSDGRRLCLHYDTGSRTFTPTTYPPKGMAAPVDLHPDSLKLMMALLSENDIAFAARVSLIDGY